MGIYEPFQQIVAWGNAFKSDINDHSPNTASSSIIQVDARIDDHNNNNIIKVGYIDFFFSIQIFSLFFANGLILRAGELRFFA